MSEPKISFEDRLRQIAEKSIIEAIQKSNWIEINYKDRVAIPPDFIQSVWALVDADKIKAQLVKRIEAELADRLVNHIAAEMATDIKQILSVQERREAVRSIARQHLESIMKLGTDQKGQQ